MWALTHANRPDELKTLNATTAEDVLAQRLATGEIDVAEYKARLDALRDRVKPAGSVQ